MHYTLIAEGQQAGGNSLMTFLLPAVIIVLIIFLFINNKKKRQRAEQQRAQLVPGQEIMTTFGVYGTLRSIEPEANKAVIETSPGNYLTIHPQAIAPVQQSAAAGAPAGASVATAASDKDKSGMDTDGAREVPDDASSLFNDSRVADSEPTQYGKKRSEVEEPRAGETPQETLARLERERKAKGQDNN